MQNFSHYLRSETKELGSRLGLGRSAGFRILLLHAALVAVFGVYVPWTKGLAFLDPVILAPYACLGVFFAAPAAAQSFDEEDLSSMKAVMARIFIAVLYGELMAAAILLAGFTTVYATHRHSVVFAPDLVTLTAAALLGITASLALATAAVWITLRFSANSARGALRVIFLLLLALFYFRSRWLPDVADTAALICLAIAVGELFALRSLIAT
jgi:hypothetical protein